MEVLEITKPATSILQRLRTYCTFAEKAPYWKGRQPYCDVSRDMEDMHDLLHTCPQYVSEREILQDVFLVPAGHLNAYKFFFLSNTSIWAGILRVQVCHDIPCQA